MLLQGDYLNTETQTVGSVVADTNPSDEVIEADANVTQSEGADSAPAGEVEPAVKPDLDKVQQRFDKLTREKHEQRLEAEYWRAKALQQQQAAYAKPEPVAPAEYPTLESVGYDEEKHRVALIDYAKAQAREEARSVLEQERRAAREAERRSTFEKRQRDFLASKPDYVEKVLQNSSLPITQAMADVIAESEVGPAVAYFLAENPERASVIAQMGELQAAREIGRIEARIEAEQNVRRPSPLSRVTQAPPPTPTIAASETPQTIRPDSPDSDTEWSAEEWAKRRNKQIERRRK